MVLLFVVLLDWLFGLLSKPYQQKLYRPVRHQNTAHKNQRKPRWVVKTLIKIKAQNPAVGSRKIADAFNRQYGHKDTVCHSTVCKYLRIHQADIELQRRQLKRKRLFITSYHSWGVDLESRPADRRKHWLLSVIGYGIRVYMLLSKTNNKASIITKTKVVIHTNNKPTFTKWLFKAFLAVASTKHHPPDG